MSAAASAGFLKEFVTRLVPTLTYSAVPTVLMAASSGDQLGTEEGRKQIGAMLGASLLSGVAGAAAGAGAFKLGSMMRPGEIVREIRPEVNAGLRTLNKGQAKELMLNEKASIADIDERFKAVSSGLKGKQLEQANESVAGLKKYLNDPTHFNPQRSGLGETLGVLGDMGASIGAWNPIYEMLAGTSTAQPQPEQFHDAATIMSTGSQEEMISQQTLNRLLQGDGLPVEAYSPGTMFNRSGLPSYENDPYDMSHLIV